MGISQVAHGLATEAGETAPRWSAARWVITAASIGLAGFLLWRTFRNVDVDAATAVLTRTGPILLLPLLGYIVTMSVDSLGWRRLLSSVGWKLPLARIVALRISIEGIQLSLPWGSFVSESVTPVLLRRRFGVGLPQAIAATGGRKCLFALTQGLFLLIAVAVGGSMLAGAGRVAGTGSLSTAFVLVALALMTAGAVPALLLSRGAVAESLHRRLLGSRIRWVRNLIERQGAAFGTFDAHAAHVFGPARLATTVPLVLCVWLSETFETWLLLNALGVPITFWEAIPIEAGASVLRIVGVAVPAGLGVQEVGYVAFIAATGVPDPASYGVAFAVVKRAKEALWTAVGYTLLLRNRP